MTATILILGSILLIGFVMAISAWNYERGLRQYFEGGCHLQAEEIERLNAALQLAKQDAYDWERHLHLSDYRVIVNDQEFPVYKAMAVVRPTKDEHITKAKLVKVSDTTCIEHVKDIEFPFELTALAGDTFKLPMTL